jgi:predicted restriction endonuclease
MESIDNFIKNNKDKYSFYEIYNKLAAKHPINDIRLIMLMNYDIDIDEHINKITRNIEVRQYQSKLKTIALKRYNNKCIISGKTRLKCLEAAHIKPVSDCDNLNEKKDIDNILLLWIDIHRYFDSYDISINPTNQRVVVNLNKDDNKWLLKYDNKKIDGLNYNTLKYLRHHYDKYLKNI